MVLQFRPLVGQIVSFLKAVFKSLNLIKLTLKDLTSFLLNVVRSIFMEMISMDTLIVKIMNFAQKLVSADRASLFLVDAKTNQLYARIFDIMGRSIKNGDSNGNETRDFTKEIRYLYHHTMRNAHSRTNALLCSEIGLI